MQQQQPPSPQYYTVDKDLRDDESLYNRGGGSNKSVSFRERFANSSIADTSTTGESHKSRLTSSSSTHRKSVEEYPSYGRVVVTPILKSSGSTRRTIPAGGGSPSTVPPYSAENSILRDNSTMSLSIDSTYVSSLYGLGGDSSSSKSSSKQMKPSYPFTSRAERIVSDKLPIGNHMKKASLREKSIISFREAMEFR